MINYKVNDNNKYLPTEGGTLSGDLNMSGRLIKNVASPVDDSDSITKKYVEDNFATQEDFSAIGILLSLNNIVLLKVVNCNGVPAYGVTANGIKDANGNDVVIGQDGLVNGICTGTTVTFKATEMADYTYNVSSIKGSSQRTTVTLPSIENRIIRYDTTTTIKFSGITGKIDVCCVGGGGGGGPALTDVFTYSNSNGYSYGGNGGGGGNITNSYNITITPKASYTLTIGAGGACSPSNFVRRENSAYTTILKAGSDGGTTSAFGISATGGGGAKQATITYQGQSSNLNGGTSINGGTGGNGGAFEQGTASKSTAGGNSTLTEFEDGSTYYSGGGGGSGKPGGKKGGGSITSSVNGSSYGSGGGGGPFDSYTTNNGQGGNGHSGLVAIRLHDATL